MAKATNGRKNNKGVTKPPEDKKVPLTFHVKKKNHDALKEKFGPIIKKLDK